MTDPSEPPGPPGPPPAPPPAHPRTALVLGLGLLVAGLAFNQWILGAWLSRDGSFQSPAVRGAIALVQLVLIATGVLLIRRRHAIRFDRSHLVLLAVTTVITLVGAELLIRPLGYGPYRPRDAGIRVEPGGRFFARDSVLGYVHLPGRFRVTLPDGYVFHATHLPNTLRITHPLDTYGIGDPKPGIWIFGGSFTYGWSLNDEQTFPWRLQEDLPAREVVNFGVNGYGTLHALLQLRSALDRGGPPPRVAILAYAAFHDERNTFSRVRRRAVRSWSRLGPLVQPYARLEPDGSLSYHMATSTYRELPLQRYSALVHLFAVRYDRMEYARHRSHEVSKTIVREFVDLARHHQVVPVVAAIAPAGDMLDYARSLGARTVDIAVPLEGAWTNRPHDNHPSALADSVYAVRLDAFLRDSVPDEWRD